MLGRWITYDSTATMSRECWCGEEMVSSITAAMLDQIDDMGHADIKKPKPFGFYPDRMKEDTTHGTN